LDKQQLRDWITNDSGWNPDSDQPAPALPDEVVTKLSQTYADTYQRLTGTQVVPSAPLEAPAEPEAVAFGAAEQPTAEAGIAGQVEQPMAGEPGEPSAFIIDVMLREDIPDAQGAAITQTLRQLGYEGLTVRQGKRFEVDLDGELTQERVDELRRATEQLLVNTEVEDYEISLVGAFDDDDDHDHDHDHEDHDHDHDHEDHEHVGQEPDVERPEDVQRVETGEAESTGGQGE
jgi:phosphoribosylformylglycinamidine synthase PurS subunit